MGKDQSNSANFASPEDELSFIENSLQTYLNKAQRTDDTITADAIYAHLQPIYAAFIKKNRVSFDSLPAEFDSTQLLRRMATIVTGIQGDVILSTLSQSAFNIKGASRSPVTIFWAPTRAQRIINLTAVLKYTFERYISFLNQSQTNSEPE